METCWQVDPEQETVGQWLELDTQLGEIDQIGAVIGWDKDEESFNDFARIKKLKVEVFAKTMGGAPALLGTAEAAFEDKRGWQLVDIPDVKVQGEYLGASVKMTVLETYGGKDYPNLAASELRVHLKEFPADTIQFVQPPSSEDPAHSGADALDGNPKTFWAATGSQATFSVKAPGFGLASLGFHAGPKTHARAKTVKITNQAQSITHTLADKPGELQWMLLPNLSGYTGGGWGEVMVEVLDVYPGDEPMNGFAVAELKLTAGSIEEF